MNEFTTNYLPALPEMFVLAMAMLVLLVDLFLSERYRVVTAILAMLTVVGAGIMTSLLFYDQKIILFDNSFVLDKIGSVLKLFVYLTTLGAFAFSRIYIKERDFPRGEYYVLGLLSMLGMMVLISANSFLTLFLGLELMSLPLYAMVAIWRDNEICSEAAMKYFVMGAMATGLLLYGMSMIYGDTGTLILPQIANVVANTQASQDLILIFGLVFLITGIAFKIGAVPFHMWVPDVYRGAPSSVTLFIGSAPKIAALGLAIRLLVDAMPGLHFQWEQILIVMAILSIGLGNIAAIAQENIKRMLAYSSIAHMGYMSLGLIAGTAAGYSAATFYMISYSIMSMGGFAMVILLSRSGLEAENIEDFRGLNARNPWLAFMMLLLMFSMAGIPPILGFFAKLGVLEALVSVHMVWLAVYALVFAVIGAYYYLRVVKVMYFDAPAEPGSVVVAGDMRIAITLNGLAVLGLGLFPSGLIDLCRAAFSV